MSAKKPPVIRPICGEYRGAVAHTARGEELDPACKEARRLYMAEYRRKNGLVKARLYTPAEIAALQAEAADAAVRTFKGNTLRRRASRARAVVRP